MRNRSIPPANGVERDRTYRPRQTRQRRARSELPSWRMARSAIKGRGVGSTTIPGRWDMETLRQVGAEAWERSQRVGP